MSVNQYAKEPTLSNREEWKTEGRKAFIKELAVGFHAFIRFVVATALIFGGVALISLACAWANDNYGLLAGCATGFGIISGIVFFETFGNLRTADNKLDYIACVKTTWWSGSCLALCAVLFVASVFLR